jgi:hypothetical protein
MERLHKATIMGEAGKIGEVLNEGEREIVIGNSLLLLLLLFIVN